MTSTVVSTMKNEGPFILEWVAHYKTLGFDNIIVCTNDCEDTTVEILKHLEEMGLVRHHSTIVRKGGIHRSALRQASRYKEVLEAEWVFVCDVDEFLNIRVGDGSLNALIEYSGNMPDVISVPWRIFGPDNIVLFRDRLVTKQFKMGEAPVNINPQAGKFVKSLFRGMEKIKRIGLHMPVIKEEYAAEIRHVLPGGDPYIEDGQRTDNLPQFNVAQVNHYALRSVESYLIKRARGRANHSSHILGIEYWNKFNLNDEFDDSIARYDTKKSEWLEKFHADDRLFRLHRKSVRFHRARAKILRKDPDNKKLFHAIKATLKVE